MQIPVTNVSIVCAVDVMSRPVVSVQSSTRGDLLRLSATSDDVIAVGVQKLLDDYTGKRRWIAQVREGDVTSPARSTTSRNAGSPSRWPVWFRVHATCASVHGRQPDDDIRRPRAA